MDVLLQHGRREYQAMLDLTEPRHRAYADHHGLVYARYDGPLVPSWPGYWDQIALMRALLGIDAVERVFWLDADTLIVGAEDVRNGLGDADIAMARHPGPPEHWNCGVMFVRNGVETRRFFRKVIANGPGCFPWYQQDVMNALIDAGFPVSVAQLDNRWNHTLGQAESDAPVIRAWHGCGELVDRLAEMREWVNRW